ncbi:MAG: hypothetical protein KBS59_03915, partial [Clostridiales bacterium]|nr:hypothetical protein [Clostridiales bacterium]
VAAMLSNNKTRVIALSSGQIGAYDGRDLLFSSPFEKYSLDGGFEAVAYIDGSFISAVPLGYVSSGFESEYSFLHGGDRITYLSKHKRCGREYKFNMTLSLSGDREKISVECFVSGGTECIVGVYFEPVMDGEREYRAQGSFSNLFQKSKYYADEQVLVFGRRNRTGDGDEKYLGISVHSDSGRFDFDTRRDEILPLMYGTRDIARAVALGTKNTTGTMIIPACLVRTQIKAKAGRAVFDIAYSRNADDLVYMLSRHSPDRSYGKIMKLQLEASGADKTTLRLERELIRKITLGEYQKRDTGSGIMYALRKKPIGVEQLWRHGISGDDVMITAKFAGGTAVEYERFAKVMKLFKYCCIRGLRFDLIVLYTDSDVYARPAEKAIKRDVRNAGLYDFIGCGRGIHVIDEKTVSEGERYVLENCAAMYFDLTVPIEFCFQSKAHVSDAFRETELIRFPSAEILSPEQTDACGAFVKNGFILNKNTSSPPFAHIIASENFGTVLTENSLGFSFFSNAALGKLTPHTSDNMREDGGEKMILRIFKAQSAEFADFDMCASSYRTTYGDGFCEYTGKIENVKYVLRVSLCGKFPAKRISVKLYSAERVRADVIYVIKPCLDMHRRDDYCLIVPDAARGSVSFSSLCETSGRSVRGIMLCRGGKISVYTDECAVRSDGRLFDGYDSVCAIADKLDFSGDASSEFYLCAALTDAAEKYIYDTLAKYGADVAPPVLSVSPTVKYDDKYDAMVNFWLPYQTEKSRLFARSGFYQVGGAYGFRDQLQDVISLIPYAPRLCREHIIRAACHEYSDGSVMHWWHSYGITRGIKSRYTDDGVWLGFVLYEYVTKTGDRGILDTRVPYLSSEPLSDKENDRYERAVFDAKRESILSHAIRALEHAMQTGAHGLCLFGGGDWNDGMNFVGRKGKGESVWLTLFAAITAKRLSLLCDGDTSKRLDKAAKSLCAAAKMQFDGNWFLRGYYDDGTVLGSASREECKIDVMPQAFAAIAASEVDDSLTQAAKLSLTNAAELLLDEKNGIFKLLAPPFECDEQYPGYIKGYPPGIRENGGQYTHAAVFAALGMLRVGMNEEGARLLFMLNPAAKKSESYKIEPYVIAGDVYANPDNMGRGGWSWYTGAAGWYRTVFIEELCGYKESENGFSVLPRLSSVFPSFELDVKKKNTHYKVSVSLSKHGFTACDGRERENFFEFDGGEHSAEIFVCENDKIKADIDFMPLV